MLHSYLRDDVFRCNACHSFIQIAWSVALQISTVLGSAVKEQREESAWSEGVAIWVAVIVVSGVGAHVHPLLCWIMLKP